MQHYIDMMIIIATITIIKNITEFVVLCYASFLIARLLLPEKEPNSGRINHINLSFAEALLKFVVFIQFASINNIKDKIVRIV